MGSNNDTPFTQKASLDELAQVRDSGHSYTDPRTSFFGISASNSPCEFHAYIGSREPGYGSRWSSTQQAFRQRITREGVIVGFFLGYFVAYLYLILTGVL